MAGRGRPAREPTRAEREKVKEFLGEGASQRVIALALGRSIPNLRKYFSVELELENKGPKPPPFKITAGMRADVALLAACNEPKGRIAKAIGISEEQLAEHFADDLEIGAARYRLKTLNRLDRMADGGSLGAASKLAVMTTALAEAAGAAGAGGYIGKKAAAHADATDAVTSAGKFAPRSPRLAAVNGKPVGGGK